MLLFVTYPMPGESLSSHKLSFQIQCSQEIHFLWTSLSLNFKVVQKDIDRIQLTAKIIQYTILKIYPLEIFFVKLSRLKQKIRNAKCFGPHIFCDYSYWYVFQGCPLTPLPAINISIRLTYILQDWQQYFWPQQPPGRKLIYLYCNFMLWNLVQK